jgi:uncharacterized LabA/DUF88 family protein
MNVGIFADIGNLYYCISKKFPGRKLDYEKYLQTSKIDDDYTVLIAKAYGTQMNEEAQGFITCLKKIGYTTHFKTLQGLNRRVHWDCQIALDVEKHIDRLDIIVLGTANPDFVPLVEWIKNKGRRCIIHAAGINKELKAATSFYEIGEDLLEMSKDQSPDQNSSEQE